MLWLALGGGWVFPHGKKPFQEYGVLESRFLFYGIRPTKILIA